MKNRFASNYKLAFNNTMVTMIHGNEKTTSRTTLLTFFAVKIRRGKLRGGRLVLNA